MRTKPLCARRLLISVWHITGTGCIVSILKIFKYEETEEEGLCRCKGNTSSSHKLSVYLYHLIILLLFIQFNLFVYIRFSSKDRNVLFIMGCFLIGLLQG